MVTLPKIALLLLLVGCQRPGGVVMPMGDSIAKGCHSGTGVGAWRVMLAGRFDETGAEYDMVGSQRGNCPLAPDKDHEAYSGFTIQQITEIAPAAMDAYDPQTIVLQVGTNNFRGEADDDYAGAYAALLDVFGQRRVYAFTPPPIGYDRVPAASYWSDDWVDARNVTLLAIGGGLRDAARSRPRVTVIDGHLPAMLLTPDAVHPSADGHAVLFGRLWGAMEGGQ